MAPSEAAAPDRSHTATWRMQAFGVRHKLGEDWTASVSCEIPVKASIPLEEKSL